MKNVKMIAGMLLLLSGTVAASEFSQELKKAVMQTPQVVKVGPDQYGCVSYTSHVAQLAAQKPGLNKPDACGSTALHYATAAGYLQNVQDILVAGADANVVDNFKLTPLVIAQVKAEQDPKKFQPIVALLKQYGAKTDVKGALVFKEEVKTLKPSRH